MISEAGRKQQTIRIMMVSCAFTFAEVLRELLKEQQDIDIVAEVCDSAKILGEASDLKPHVILMDTDIAGIGGIEVTRRLSILQPVIRVIVLTPAPKEDEMFQAIAMGASAYLSKDRGPADILDAIRSVMKGEFLSRAPGKVSAATSINRLILVSRHLTQELRRDPTAEELALEMEFLSHHEKLAILEAQAEGEPLELELDRRLRRAARKVHRIERLFRDKILLNKGGAVDRLPGIDIPIAVKSIIIPQKKVAEGKLIKSVGITWSLIAQQLIINPDLMYELKPYVWEELIAATFDRAGFDEVVLTPRSGDHGRDVIAIKHGVGEIRIIDSVKAYKPGNLVRHDDVRALMGVLSNDRNASKAILTTTSDFPVSIKKEFASQIPYRLELINGTGLRRWLRELAHSDRD